MRDAERHVTCAEHGEREATFVCQHLPKGEGLGFHQGNGRDEPDAMLPDAWCDACEVVRREAEGWNASSESLAGSTSYAQPAT